MENSQKGKYGDSIQEIPPIFSLQNIKNFLNLPRQYSLWTRVLTIFNPELSILLHKHENLLIAHKEAYVANDKNHLSNPYVNAKWLQDQYKSLRDSKEYYKKQALDPSATDKKTPQEIEDYYQEKKLALDKMKSSIAAKDNTDWETKKGKQQPTLTHLANVLKTKEQKFHEATGSHIEYDDRQMKQYIAYNVFNKDPYSDPIDPPSIFSLERWQLAFNAPEEFGVHAKILAIASPEYASVLEGRNLKLNQKATKFDRTMKNIEFKERVLKAEEDHLRWEEKESQKFLDTQYQTNKTTILSLQADNPESKNISLTQLDTNYQLQKQILFNTTQENNQYITQNQEQLSYSRSSAQRLYRMESWIINQKTREVQTPAMIGMAILTTSLFTALVYSIYKIIHKIITTYQKTKTESQHIEQESPAQKKTTLTDIDVENTTHHSSMYETSSCEVEDCDTKNNPSPDTCTQQAACPQANIQSATATPTKTVEHTIANL